MSITALGFNVEFKAFHAESIKPRSTMSVGSRGLMGVSRQCFHRPVQVQAASDVGIAIGCLQGAIAFVKTTGAAA